MAAVIGGSRSPILERGVLEHSVMRDLLPRATASPDVVSLEKRLQELLAELEKATRRTEEYRSRIAKLKDAIKELEDHRKHAAAMVGDLSRCQVSEIRQYARNPPEAIRRTLSATWLLLHTERFRGRPNVRFDETKDWRLLQRMLGEDGFVTSILEFDTMRLAEVPQVPIYVGSAYLGLKWENNTHYEGLGTATGSHMLQQALSRTASQASLANGSNRRESRPVHLRRSSRLSSSQMLRPLDVDSVSRASIPCGKLLQWMQRLVVEAIERDRLQSLLDPIESELQAAEVSQKAVSTEVAEVETAIAAASALCKRTPSPRSNLLATQTEKIGGPGWRRRHMLPMLCSPSPSSPREQASSSARRAGARSRRTPRELPPVQTPTPGPSPAPEDSPAGGLLNSPKGFFPRPVSRSNWHRSHSALSVHNLHGAHEGHGSHAGPAPFAGMPKLVEDKLLGTKVELDVTGSLTSVRQKLARLRVAFVRNRADVSESDRGQAEVLAGIRALLGEHRGRLKLRLVGHCEHNERRGTDLERSAAVSQWLQATAGFPAGWLRVEGKAATQDGGRFVVPSPVRELVPLCGPISAEVAAFSAPVGVYFEAHESRPTREAVPILAEMARWLAAEATSAFIEGHSDPDEASDLALERAGAVQKALVRHGVDARRLRSQGRGSLCLLSKHSAPNRRVEIHLD